MALEVEGVVEGAVDAEKALCGIGRFEAPHFALPPSQDLVRVLGAIVHPQPLLMPAGQAELQLLALGSAFLNELGPNQVRRLGARMQPNQAQTGATAATLAASVRGTSQRRTHRRREQDSNLYGAFPVK